MLRQLREELAGFGQRRLEDQGVVLLFKALVVGLVVDVANVTAVTSVYDRQLSISCDPHIQLNRLNSMFPRLQECQERVFRLEAATMTYDQWRLLGRSGLLTKRVSPFNIWK